VSVALYFLLSSQPGRQSDPGTRVSLLQSSGSIYGFPFSVKGLVVSVSLLIALLILKYQWSSPRKKVDK